MPAAKPFWGDVQGHVGPHISPAALACAANQQGDLHLCVFDANNVLWHTIRFADRSWQPFWGDVQSQVTPNIGPIQAIACATNQQGDLHVFGIDQNGVLWHTIRMADGTWPFPFGNVQVATRG